MKRVLLVDDEAAVLDGLRNILRRYRKEWTVVCAYSAAEGLQHVADTDFDVVISDLRMPEMDGVAFLERVREQQPGCARIVLSGYADMETVERTVTVAHSFLAKPTEAETLEAAIRTALAHREQVVDPRVREIVGRIGVLPSPPDVFLRLGEVLDDPDTGAADIAAEIKTDVALSSRVLQLVNSAFFRAAKRITSVDEAVGRLGYSTIRFLVLSAEAFGNFDVSDSVGISLTRLQEHALSAAGLCKKIVQDDAVRQDAEVAALLMDVGQLVLATQEPELLAQAIEEARAADRPLHEVEAEIIGSGHPEVGAYLLGLWNLPKAVVDAVAGHHCPTASAETPEVTLAVHLADALAAAESDGDGVFVRRHPIDPAVVAGTSYEAHVAHLLGKAAAGMPT